MTVLIWLKIIVLSIIEGLTEFIPVSSTGHLIIADKFLMLPSNNTESIQIAIQLGAISAVFVMYKSKIATFFESKKSLITNFYKLSVAAIPTYIFGFLLYDTIKEKLFSPIVVAIGLISGACLMLLAEKRLSYAKCKTDIESISYKQATIIGCFQTLSLCPGMSRSGSTITGGIFSNIDHKTSADFAFLLGIPVIGAAVCYDLLKTANELTSMDWMMIAYGSIFSFIVACIAIKLFIRWVSQYKLYPFAFYRIFIGISILILFR